MAEIIEYKQAVNQCPVCKSKNVLDDSISFVVDDKHERAAE